MYTVDGLTARNVNMILNYEYELCFFQESFSEHLGFTGGIVQGLVFTLYPFDPSCFL